MAKRTYTEAELLHEHAYARPHEEAGRALHGGFDATGRYLSPRTALRWEAIEAWNDALAAEGVERVPADRSLLVAGAYPTFEQMKLLLENDLGQSLWNSLTVTGVIEGRGRFLVDFDAPEFADVVVEDVSERAVGHLNRGLLKAHGLDEGGDPTGTIGGHDVMWFAIRDLLFGADAYPMPEIPPNIGRPERERLAPILPEAHEGLLLLLMNVLMIEVRAENMFDFVERIVRDPQLFRDRRAEADRAAELVGRIRKDEEIHVAYLRTVISELRGLTFHNSGGKPEGPPIPGHSFLDPIWRDLVHWHAVEVPRRSRPEIRERIEKGITVSPSGARLLERYRALEPEPMRA